MTQRSQRHLIERQGYDSSGYNPGGPGTKDYVRLSDIQPNVVIEPAFGLEERIVAFLTVRGGLPPFQWQLLDNAGLLLIVEPGTNHLVATGDPFAPFGVFTVRVNVRDWTHEEYAEDVRVEVV